MCLAEARFCDDSEKFENYAGNAANDKRGDVLFTAPSLNIDCAIAAIFVYP